MNNCIYTWFFFGFILCCGFVLYWRICLICYPLWCWIWDFVNYLLPQIYL